MTLTVHDPHSTAMVLVALGVFTNFSLKLIRLKLNEKRLSQTTIDEAKKSQLHARLSNHFNDKYRNGNNALDDAEQEFKKFNYEKARERALEAQDLYKQALLISPSGQFQGEDSDSSIGRSSDLSTISKIKRIFIPGGTDYAVYAGLSIVLGISVLQVWQLFFPKVEAFGTSGIDYVATFLFGFASEALLSEAVDFAKR